MHISNLKYTQFVVTNLKHAKTQHEDSSATIEPTFINADDLCTITENTYCHLTSVNVPTRLSFY